MPLFAGATPPVGALEASAMRILVTNDDGIDAPGLTALVDALTPLGEVITVAPRVEQSAKSHALTMHEPLRVTRYGERRFAVSGTPADSVYLAIHHLCPDLDLVVSGINGGANLGDDVHYSGTVAAAMEAAVWGVPALAVSLAIDPNAVEHHWQTAGTLARRVARCLHDDPLPRDRFLNLNVPDVPLSRLPGVRVTSMSRRHYHPQVRVDEDPRGRACYWIGGAHRAFTGGDDSDGVWAERGWATLTPLQPDLTDWPSLRILKGWDLDLTSSS